MQKFASEKLNARLAENLAPNEEVLWTSENCKATGDMMFLYWSHLCIFLFVFALMAITPMKYMFLALFDSSRPFPVFSLIIFVPFTGAIFSVVLKKALKLLRKSPIYHEKNHKIHDE